MGMSKEEFRERMLRRQKWNRIQKARRAERDLNEYLGALDARIKKARKR